MFHDESRLLSIGSLVRKAPTKGCDGSYLKLPCLTVRFPFDPPISPRFISVPDSCGSDNSSLHHMATVRSLPSASWHLAECGICGCAINQTNIRSYRAISTLPDANITHEIRRFSKDTLVLGAGISYSGVRMQGTSPTWCIVDIRCLNILRCTWAGSTVPLRVLISIVKPALPIVSGNYHALSHLDAAAIVSALGKPRSRKLSKACLTQCISESVFRAIQRLPVEIIEAILQYCEPDLVLAIASRMERSPFDFTAKKDIVRKRIRMCIEAEQLLDSGKDQRLYTERVVTLSEKMKATFVCYGGEMYLGSISKETNCPNAVDIFISKGQPEVLALHTDEFGIRNIAFALDDFRRPKRIRGDARKHHIFLDEGRTFERIRMVSDVSTNDVLRSL